MRPPSHHANLPLGEQVPHGVAAAWLAALVVVGAALRFYRLSDQSVWLDEFVGIATLNGETPLASLRLLGIYFPEHGQCPLFYNLLYCWGHIFGQSVPVLRTLPVVLGIVTIPLVYGFSRYLYGHRVAVVAGLCYTLSPQHVWHAQEPRQYCLVMPLVIMALYALLRALDERKAIWWVINLLANTLLVWTHVLDVLVLLVQGLFMLVFYRRMFWRTACWATIQLALLVPWTFWMLAMPYMYEIPGDASLGDVVQDILFDDVVSYHTDLLPPYKTNPIELASPLARRLLQVQPIFDMGLVLLISCAVAAFIFRPLWIKWKQGRGEMAAARSRKEIEQWVLLAILLIVPNALLGIAAHAFQAQVLGPMYAMYNTLAIYISIGLLLTILPWRNAWRSGAALICCLYAFQLALVLPETTRSDWGGIARHLEEHATSQDRIFDIQFYGPASYLPYNWPDRLLPIERVWTMEAAVKDATAFLASAEHQDANAWIVYEDYLLRFRWPHGARDMEAALRKRNLNCERTVFPGHYNASLLRISAKPDTSPLLLETPVPAADERIDYPALLREIGLDSTDPETRELRLKALRRYVSFWPPSVLFFVFFQADSALAGGEIEMAEAMQKWLLKTKPEFGLAHFGLGLVQASKMDPYARASFEIAFAQHRGLDKLFGRYVNALLDQQNCDTCLAEVDRLESRGYIAFAPALRAACRYRAEAVSGEG